MKVKYIELNEDYNDLTLNNAYESSPFNMKESDITWFLITNDKGCSCYYDSKYFKVEVNK